VATNRSGIHSHKTASGSWAEKRGPNRPFKDKTQKSSSVLPSQNKHVSQKTGTDDDWSEF